MVTTQININNSRNSGAPSGGASKELGEVSKQLKELTNVFKKAARVEGSGVLGGGATGILASALKLLGGAGAGIIGGLGSIALGGLGGGSESEGAEQFNKGFSYEKALVDGEEKILKVSVKTGDILDMLTIEEAIQQNILDKKGDIRSAIDINNKLWESLSEEMPKYKDQVVINVKNVSEISSLTEQEKELRREIISVLEQKLLKESRGITSTREALEAIDKASKLGESLRDPGATPSAVSVPTGPSDTARINIIQESSSSQQSQIDSLINNNFPLLDPASYFKQT